MHPIGPVRWRVLGPLEVQAGDTPVSVAQGKQIRLLAMLLLARGRVVAADRLIDALWGESAPDGARAGLHVTVTRLRRSLEPVGDVVLHRPPGYALALTGASIDADEFAELHRRAIDLAATEPHRTVALLDAALALWRGPAWGQLAADLALGEALRLEELRLEATEERAAALLACGRTGEAIGALEMAVAEHPLRERAVALLLDALGRHGEIERALAIYDAFRRRLADELGLDPSPTITAAHRRILRHENLERPAPERRHAEPPSPQRHPAVDADAPLVGRQSELAALGEHLRRRRLVTVVGPGGVGKTRLVSEATRTGATPSWWVDLAPVPEGSGVLPAAAAALGVEASAGTPLAIALRQRLDNASGTLVLDNCEHVLPAVADLVGDVLAHAPSVRVLATSRERLNLAGEQVMPLAPLALPAPDHADPHAPAVQLFLARARDADPQLHPDPRLLRRVATICRQLDGLPLALELAAGRVGTLTIDDLADRLTRHLSLLRSPARRRPTRHATMSAAIAWSYQLLDDEERLVFLRLSAFPTQFDLASAEQLAGFAPVEPDAVADVVARLADRSMLARPGSAGPGRYRMLETLRQFATGQLDPADLDAVRRRHAEAAVALAEAAEHGVFGPDERHWATRLEESMDDVQAALAWATSTGRRDLAARVVAALRGWAYLRSRTDVLAWSRRLLATGDPLPRRPEIIAAAAHEAWIEGRLFDAKALARAALAAADPADDVGGGAALEALGDVALLAGDLTESDDAFREAVRRHTRCGQSALAASAQAERVLARSYGHLPDDGLLKEALRQALATGNPSCIALARYAEGEMCADADPERALTALDEAHRLAASVGNRLVLGLAMTSATALRGRHLGPSAGTYEAFHGAITHWQTTGNSTLLVTTLRNLVPLLVRAGAHRPALMLAAALAAGANVHDSYGPEEQRLAAAVAQAAAGLPAEDVAAARATGSDLTPAAAGRYAVTVLAELLNR